MSSRAPNETGAPQPSRSRSFFGWLRGYDRAAFPADLVAGLTAAAVVLPKAMAYATVASLPVQVGLTTALVPPVVYAALGRSSVLSVSTTTTIAILVGSVLEGAVPGAEGAELVAAAATLSVLVGVVLVAAAALRLGFVATFISEPVLAGFKAGIGAVIVLDQIPKLLGSTSTRSGSSETSWASRRLSATLPSSSGAARWRSSCSWVASCRGFPPRSWRWSLA